MTQKVEEIVKKLLTYRNRTFPILSVYLRIPPEKSNRNSQLRNNFQELIESKLKTQDTAIIQDDLNYIDAFLATFNQWNSHRSVVIFSGGNKLWEVLNLHDELPNSLKLDHSPYLLPLLEMIGKYRRYLIVLADREKAKYFTIHMGQLESQGELLDDSVPQKVKGRGAKELTKRMDRHIKQHLSDHFKYIGREVNNFTRNKELTGVLIGGHKHLLANIKSHLPKHLQQKIIGEFISELNINMNQILSESKKIINRINRQLNQQQVFST